MKSKGFILIKSSQVAISLYALVISIISIVRMQTDPFWQRKEAKMVCAEKEILFLAFIILAIVVIIGIGRGKEWGRVFSISLNVILILILFIVRIIIGVFSNGNFAFFFKPELQLFIDLFVTFYAGFLIFLLSKKTVKMLFNR